MACFQENFPETGSGNTSQICVICIFGNTIGPKFSEIWKLLMPFSHLKLCDWPFEQISWKCLFGEIPGLIYHSGHLHCIFRWKDCSLNHPASIDEDLSSQSIYIHRVAEVWMQELIYWVKHTQLPVRCNNKWLYCCMDVQPAPES